MATKKQVAIEVGAWELTVKFMDVLPAVFDKMPEGHAELEQGMRLAVYGAFKKWLRDFGAR